MMSRLSKRDGNRNGVTLLHLLAAAVVSIAAAVILRQFLATGPTEESRIRRHTRICIQNVDQAARVYAKYHGDKYPQSLEQLLEPEEVGGGYREPFLAKVPRDAWGTPIQYRYSPGDEQPLIRSFGPDKQEDGGDDLTNLDDQF